MKTVTRGLLAASLLLSCAQTAAAPVQGFDVQMSKIEHNLTVDPSMCSKPSN